mgnify:CR=1 FL=1
MDFKNYMNKDKSSDVTDSKMDILISEIKGLRSDINMLVENRQPVNTQTVKTQAQPQQPVVEAVEEQQTLFGMPMPKRADQSLSRQETVSLKERAGKILA